MNLSIRIAASALAAVALVACGSTDNQQGQTEIVPETEQQVPQFKLGDVVRVQAQGDSILDVILTDFQKDPDMQAKIASGVPGVMLANSMPAGAVLWRVHLEAREVSGLPKVSGSEPHLHPTEGTVIEAALLEDGEGSAFHPTTLLDGQVMKGFNWYIVPEGETPAKFVWIRNVPPEPLAEWPL